MQIDPASAARYALVAVCLVLVGAVLTASTSSVEQRGAVLGGLVTVLLILAYRHARAGDG